MKKSEPAGYIYPGSLLTKYQETDVTHTCSYNTQRVNIWLFLNACTIFFTSIIICCLWFAVMAQHSVRERQWKRRGGVGGGSKETTDSNQKGRDVTGAGGLFWAGLRCPACASSHAHDPRSQRRLGGRAATNHETDGITGGRRRWWRSAHRCPAGGRRKDRAPRCTRVCMCACQVGCVASICKGLYA